MAWIDNQTIWFSKPERYNLYALSDLQIGSESCNKTLIRRTIDTIRKDPRGMIVIAGDIEDDDRPSTRGKRRQMFADRPEVLNADAMKHLQWVDREVLPVLMPLTKMPIGIVGVLAGHHWSQLTPSMNSVQYICNRLSELGGKKVPYWGEMSAWLYIRFKGKGKWAGKSVTKLAHVQHGAGGGQSLASALNKLEITSQGFPADVYIRAHDCKLVAAKTAKVYPRDHEGVPELNSNDVALLNVGAATRGYNLTVGPPDYVEAMMMRPTALGWGTVHFDIRSSFPWEGAGGVMADIKVEI